MSGTCELKVAGGRVACGRCGAAAAVPFPEGAAVAWSCDRGGGGGGVPAETAAARLAVCGACPWGERRPTPAGDVCEAFRRAKPGRAGLIAVGVEVPAARCPHGAWGPVGA